MKLTEELSATGCPFLFTWAGIVTKTIALDDGDVDATIGPAGSAIVTAQAPEGVGAGFGSVGVSPLQPASESASPATTTAENVEDRYMVFTSSDFESPRRGRTAGFLPPG
ncbi:MAG: hypothetical protein ACM3JH_12410, partial [Acidithiobacillales bacterium]